MDNAPQFQPNPDYQIDKYALQAKLENYKLEQNLPLGILGALIGGGLGAVIWALVTYYTEIQVGWFAIGVGFLTGFGNRFLGKGFDRIFGILGAVVALASVLIGNLLSAIGFLAEYFEVSFLEMLVGFNYTLIFQLLSETFSVMDLLFYAMAVYTGYRFSFRKISKAELLEGVMVKSG